MNDLETNQLAAATRVRDFGTQHPQLFPAGQLAGQLITVLTTEVDQLNSHAATHAASASSRRQSTTSKRSARIALKRDIDAISRTARAMALDNPGLDDKFRAPRSGDQNLLTAARAFALEAAPLKSEFMRFGLPADFIETLLADIATFEQANMVQNQSMEQKTASTAQINESLDRCMKAMKQIDAILRNTLRDNVALLTAWITASRVERVARRRKPPAPPSPAPEPPKS